MLPFNLHPLFDLRNFRSPCLKAGFIAQIRLLFKVKTWEKTGFEEPEKFFKFRPYKNLRCHPQKTTF